MPAVATEIFPSAQAVIDRMRERPIPGQRVSLRLDAPLDRDSFLTWCAEHPEARAELEADGTITLMTPVVLQSNEDESQVFIDLAIWHRQSNKGKVYSSTAGFTLPDGSVRSPDAAWVSFDRLAQTDPAELQRFARLVPDFVVEVVSKTDNLRKAKQKMDDTWLAAGVRLGWLLDPKRQRAHVYTREGRVETLHGFRRELSADPVVPGFTFDLRRLAR